MVNVGTNNHLKRKYIKNISKVVSNFSEESDNFSSAKISGQFSQNFPNYSHPICKDLKGDGSQECLTKIPSSTMFCPLFNEILMSL